MSITTSILPVSIQKEEEIILDFPSGVKLTSEETTSEVKYFYLILLLEFITGMGHEN